MLPYDLMQISVRQIARHSRRYRGVIIGMALGIGGLITVLVMGEAVESGLGKNLEVLGSATIIKASWQKEITKRLHQGQYHKKDVQDIMKLPGVESVSPAVWLSDVTLGFDRRKTLGRLMGIEANFFKTVYVPVSEGRKLVEEDVTKSRRVCVLGKTLASKLFGTVSETDIGKQITIAGELFGVVGLLGGVEDPLYLETVLIPMPVARLRFQGLYEIRDIYIRGINWDVVPALHASIIKLLKNNQPSYEDSMEITYFPDRINSIKRTIFLIKFFIYASLSVTLLLGGLGITNVMLAAVQERTREIGLKKAVGATGREIMAQFLIESTSISLMGAITGVATGFLSITVLTRILGAEPSYEALAYSVFGSVLLGVITGIVSGFTPARRASLLDPAMAMKFE
jgi:putative ABC transport system permease protein